LKMIVKTGKRVATTRYLGNVGPMHDIYFRFFPEE
jgi:hypothetical protein